MRRQCRLVVLGTMVLFAPVATAAWAWPPGGVVVAPIPPPGGQTEPRLLLGQNSSVLAFWSDGRWFDGSADVYAQLVNQFGQIATGWPDSGLMVARARDDQRVMSGLSHPDGSFIVGFSDRRNHVVGGTRADAYITRILPDGRIHPSWPRHGFRVIGRPNDEGPGRMFWAAPDVVLVLSGYQHPTDPFINFLPLLQRVVITSDAPTLPWGPDGILYQWRPFGVGTTLQFCTDSEGGAFVLFDEFDWSNEGAPGDIYLMRVAADGQASPGWTTPVAVTTAVGIQEYADMCSDGAGGVFVVWADAREGAGLPFPSYTDYEDIRLLRLTSNGEVYPGWPSEGMMVSDAPGWQYLPRLLPDGTGGVYVAFDDISIGLTRVRGDGSFASGWAKNGIQISTWDAYSTNARMVLDGIGGVYLLYDDAGAINMRLQHVLPWGQVDPGWPSGGYLASPARDLGTGNLVSDGAGGCYVTSRRPSVPGVPGNELVFVSRYSPDGVVPVKLAEATIEAEPDRVHLAWHGVEDVAADLRVQRRPAGIETWTSLGSPWMQGRDVVEYEDTTVAPGGRYAYRLIRGAEILSEEQWVSVPENVRFALRGAWPNPAPTGELVVELSLAGTGGARLEVLDVAGRREYARELGHLQPGRHALPLADAQISPGVHWLRLSEGARVAHTRFVVVR